MVNWRRMPSACAGASGINFAETRMRAGDYSGQVPFVGMEVAGSVEQGPPQRTSRWATGFLVACAVRMLIVDCDPAHLMLGPESEPHQCADGWKPDRLALGYR